MTAGRAPVIGIVAQPEQIRFGVWDVPGVMLPAAYVEAVQRAGGLVMMIPPDAALAADPAPMLERIDGLILAGGNDVDPASYGADPHRETNGTSPERDRTEISLIAGAIARDMAVLGICRGMQVLNAARGGTLIQHVPDVLGTNEHRRHPGSFVGSEHDVTLAAGSLASRVAGEEHHEVRSHHHQAVGTVGEGLVITGRAVDDDLAESIELPGCSFVLGVQWHPEVDPGSRVIDAFVARVRDQLGGE